MALPLSYTSDVRAAKLDIHPATTAAATEPPDPEAAAVKAVAGPAAAVPWAAAAARDWVRPAQQPQSPSPT